MMNIGVLVVMAAALVGQNNFKITGTVVDAREQPVAGAEVVLSSGVARDGSVPIIGKATTGNAGQFEIDQPLASRRSLMLEGALWAYKPGFGLGLVELIRADLPNTSHRLVLETPEERKLTIRDVDGKPIVGALVAARIARTELTSYLGGTVPDGWLARLTATTDRGGIAALAFLPQRTELRSVRLAIPGRGTHFVTLPYQNGKGDVTLSLGHPAKLAGEVKNPSGFPVAGAG